ncbi:MAG: TetR/AcrR family transcriptional regulator [Myxococcota bacterium]
MGRPRQVTDEQILTATRQVVLERGPQVSLDAVAQELGVTSPALLKRFGNRQTLLVEALRPNMDQLERLFQEPIDARPFVDQLDDLLERLSRYFRSMFPCLMALRESGIPREEFESMVKLPPHVAAVRSMEAWLGGMEERGFIRTDATETVAMAIVGAISTRTITHHFAAKFRLTRTQREYQRELAELFASALGAKPKQKTRRLPGARRRHQRTRTSS